MTPHLDITIPPEALEAAEMEILNGIASARFDSKTIARAACLAMLKAWPGMFVAIVHTRTAGPRIILPLMEKPAE